MSLGIQILAWRRHKHFTQDDLAEKTGLSRPYLSRLERERIDPTLSSLRRLASALEIRVGQLIDEPPPTTPLTRHQMDALARAAIHPGKKNAQQSAQSRVLTRLIKERRKALGLYVPRQPQPTTTTRCEGTHAARWLRASLGEEQWRALLSRIDKHASLEAKIS